MDDFKETLISIDSGKFNLSELVSILELTLNKIDIDTVSGMARKENKTPRGILISSKYRKMMIGCQKMVIKGIEDNKLPF